MSINICIIGLGYVGLPLAIAFSKKYPTIGYDTNLNRVKELQKGVDQTDEVTSSVLKKVKNVHFTTDIKAASSSNYYIVTVPTPIDERNKPNLTPILTATQMISHVLKKSDIVIYESTVYPGVTEEICVPILEKSGFKFNIDFFCGYSPERINTGDKKRPLEKIIKITSGSTPATAQKVDALYRSIITSGTFLAKSIRVAEAAKVVENTQRDVNIALINELALIFDSLNINTHDVLDAAATKWNFINLKPGLVGGHCIGIDPYYLTYKAKRVGFRPNLILQSRQINNGMGHFIVERTIKLMIHKEQKVKHADILILGITFKENCPDIRNSRVFDIINGLKQYDCSLEIYDPWIKASSRKKNASLNFISNPFKKNKKYHAVICAVAHKSFYGITRLNLSKISYSETVVIDVKNCLPYSDWTL